MFTNSMHIPPGDIQFHPIPLVSGLYKTSWQGPNLGQGPYHIYQGQGPYLVYIKQVGMPAGSKLKTSILGFSQMALKGIIVVPSVIHLKFGTFSTFQISKQYLDVEDVAF